MKYAKNNCLKSKTRKIKSAANGNPFSHPSGQKPLGQSASAVGVLFPLYQVISMAEGYFKVWRQIRENAIWGDTFCLAVFLYCLNHAEWKDGRKTIFRKYEVSLHPGQLSTGRKQIAFEMKLSESTVRNCLKRLKEIYKIVDIESDTTKSIITILNWYRYQDSNFNKDIKKDTGWTPEGHQEDTPEAFKHLSIKEKSINNINKESVKQIIKVVSNKKSTWKPGICPKGAR